MSVNASNTWTIKATPAVMQAAKNAIEIQNACNLLAVLRQMHADLTKITAEMQEMGETISTPGRNQHPVTLAYLDKLNSLARIQIISTDISAPVLEIYNKISQAYDACTKLSHGQAVEWSVSE